VTKPCFGSLHKPHHLTEEFQCTLHVHGSASEKQSNHHSQKCKSLKRLKNIVNNSERFMSKADHHSKINKQGRYQKGNECSSNEQRIG